MRGIGIRETTHSSLYIFVITQEDIIDTMPFGIIDSKRSFIRICAGIHRVTHTSYADVVRALVKPFYYKALFSNACLHRPFFASIATIFHAVLCACSAPCNKHGVTNHFCVHFFGFGAIACCNLYIIHTSRDRIWQFATSFLISPCKI